MKIRQVDDAGGRRTFVLVCDPGDDPLEALTATAKRFDLRAASLTGIGALAAVTLGFFDHARRDYRRRVIREQVEVLSLIGNIALDRGETRVQAHVVVGRSDGAALGGHRRGRRPDPGGHARGGPGCPAPEDRPGDGARVDRSRVGGTRPLPGGSYTVKCSLHRAGRSGRHLDDGSEVWAITESRD